MTAALQHLRSDPLLAPLITRIGRCQIAPERKREPFEALVRAIAHQQLHGRAAQAILNRFIGLYPGVAFPPPHLVLATEDSILRATGLSGSKIAALRDICAGALNGVVPTRRVANRLTDDELIAQLVTLRGVGRWTVEMLLIFTLGRPDVLPVDDFGVREGFRLLHGLDVQPTPKALREYGTAWAPYRSSAAWYLWRRADEAKKVKQPVAPS
jgi:DNA-3-methyladenine glycosylase II